MTSFPVLSALDGVKALGRAGFTPVGRKGSHIRLKRRAPGPVRVVIVPDHGEIRPGTMASILRQSGLSRAEFLALLLGTVRSPAVLTSRRRR